MGLFTPDYLRKEISKFWEMTGDKKYSIKSMDRACSGLCSCFLHTKDIQPDDACSISFEAAMNNWQRVRLFREFEI